MQASIPPSPPSRTWNSLPITRTISLNQSSIGYRILVANATSPLTNTDVTFQQIHDISPGKPMAFTFGEELFADGSASWDNWSVVIGDDPKFTISRGSGGSAVRCELTYTATSWSYELLDSSGAVTSQGTIASGATVAWDAPPSDALTLNVNNATSSSTNLTVKETRRLGTSDTRSGADGEDMYLAWTLGVPTGTQVWTVSAGDRILSSVLISISPPSTPSTHSAFTAPLAEGVRRTLSRLSARSKS